MPRLNAAARRLLLHVADARVVGTHDATLSRLLRSHLIEEDERQAVIGKGFAIARTRYRLTDRGRYVVRTLRDSAAAGRYRREYAPAPPALPEPPPLPPDQTYPRHREIIRLAVARVGRRPRVSVEQVAADLRRFLDVYACDLVRAGREADVKFVGGRLCRTYRLPDVLPDSGIEVEVQRDGEVYRAVFLAPWLGPVAVSIAA